MFQLMVINVHKKAIDVNRHHLLLCFKKIINEKLMFQLMVINVHKKSH